MKNESIREDMQKIYNLMPIGFIGCDNEKEAKQLERAYLEHIYRMLKQQELYLLNIDNRLGANKNAM